MVRRCHRPKRAFPSPICHEVRASCSILCDLYYGKPFMLKLSIAAMLIGGNGRNGAKNEAAARIAAELTALARQNPEDALHKLNPGGQALNPEQVAERLEQYGPNVVAQEKKKPFLLEIGERFITNPINILLTALALITWFTGEETSDKIGAVIMFAMVVM